MSRKTSSDDIKKVHDCARACRRLILDLLTTVENGRVISSEQVKDLQDWLDKGHRAINPKPTFDGITRVQQLFMKASDQMDGEGRELCGCKATCAHGAVLRLADKVLQTIARGGDIRSVVDHWQVVNHNALIERERRLAEASTSQAQAKIPPDERTIPMTYRKAAKLMGKENSRDAAEWLSASVNDGNIRCEHITRQAHVFSRLDFPEEVWDRILPKSPPTDPKSP